MHHLRAQWFLYPRILKEMARLYASAFSEEPWNEVWTEDSALAELLSLVRKGATAFYVLTMDRELCAFGFGWTTTDGFYIGEVVTAQAYRSQGLGGCIVQEMVKYAQANQLDAVTVRTRVDNHPMLRVLQREGFTETGREKVETGGVESLRIYFRLLL
jgi:ribosomal protein S18 acetylase RimI-like enzyme